MQLDAQTLAAIFGAGGIGAVLLAITKGTFDWINGSHAREKSRNADIAQQRNDAVARAQYLQDRLDRESAKRRIIAEHAGTLRVMLIESGAQVEDLPKWPSLDELGE